MDAELGQPHPLTPQLIHAINYYGLDDVLAAMAEATVQVATGMQATGADPAVVTHHLTMANILAQAATV